MSSYKWCVVPGCRNTTIKTPDKLFICAPKDIKMRRKWLQLARRNPSDISIKTVIFFCEDHFDIEKDMANYCKYKMGFSQKILMVDGVLPSKFHCQPDRCKRICEPGTSRSAFAKRQRINLIEQCEAEICQPAGTEDKSHEGKMEDIITEPSTSEKSTTTDPITIAEKSVQFNSSYKLHFRSKAVQTKIFTRDTSVSPYKYSFVSSSTSPFKIDQHPFHVKPSKSGVINIKKRIGFDEDKSDADASSLYTEAPKQDSSSYTASSKLSDTSASSITNTNEDILKLQSSQINLQYIVKKPTLYIGISKESYFIVNLIHKHTNIPHEHILLCLKKIRLNNTFSELEDDFGFSLSYGSKLFTKNIPVIASVLRPFIVKLDNYSIKKTLPISFRHNYHNVSCIIDCLEIDIQKPSKALFQALTWSDYKKDGLNPGSFILADRGFKHVEQVLNEKGIKLLRPPSVQSGSKLSKAEMM
ncbi:uncharacterized protein LOC123699569 [Colias croceus]|uniref:uncharacterized protein LOC123699569 n=1 Tax=Colias crocea TaxID=72248 RepID=UPI001E27DBCF|nr:uncharacterized protein LOC123699569 [Colias croceus]